MGRCSLFDAAFAHEDNLIGHTHGLTLVVSDIDHRDAELCCSSRISRRISARNCASRLESGSSIRQTGVSAMMARPSATRCCCPPESWDGLRPSSGQGRAATQPARADATRSEAGILRTLQAKENILSDRQMREQGIGLKHHGDMPLRGREIGNVLAADENAAA